MCDAKLHIMVGNRLHIKKSRTKGAGQKGRTVGINTQGLEAHGKEGTSSGMKCQIGLNVLCGMSPMGVFSFEISS